MIGIIGNRGSGKTIEAVVCAMIQATNPFADKPEKCLILTECREYVEDLIKNFFHADDKVEVKSALLLCHYTGATDTFNYRAPFIIDELDVFNRTLRKIARQEVGSDSLRIKYIKDLVKEYMVGYTAYSADAFQELLEILEIEKESLKNYTPGYNRKYYLSYKD